VSIKARMITTGIVKITDGGSIEVIGCYAENMTENERHIEALLNASYRIGTEVTRLREKIAAIPKAKKEAKKKS